MPCLELCLTPKMMFLNLLPLGSPRIHAKHSQCFHSHILLITLSSSSNFEIISYIFAENVFSFQRFLKILEKGECYYPSLWTAAPGYFMDRSSLLITFLQVAVHPKHPNTTSIPVYTQLHSALSLHDTAIPRVGYR